MNQLQWLKSKLIEEERYEEAAKINKCIEDECFYNHFHAEIYKAILQVVSSGNRADLIFVKSKLEENGVKFDIVEYMKIVSCHTFDLYQYASRLHDLRIRRAFYSIGRE
jgi:replicative DNA helicase